LQQFSSQLNDILAKRSILESELTKEQNWRKEIALEKSQYKEALSNGVKQRLKLGLTETNGRLPIRSQHLALDRELTNSSKAAASEAKRSSLKTITSL
jgi:hypothetical protein